ncbi:MAG: hypothetical protein Q8936_24615 [Bacillota bacterium]|nr:hypothetical protein [Bacillota bacterium]
MSDIKENVEEVKVVTPKISDSEIDKMSKVIGKEINKQPKVKLRIPKDKLNPKDIVVPVCVNGYNFFINRGETVEVPEVVYDILVEAGYI